MTVSFLLLQGLFALTALMAGSGLPGLKGSRHAEQHSRLLAGIALAP